MAKWRNYPGPPSSRDVFARSPLDQLKTIVYDWRTRRASSREPSVVPMRLLGKSSFEPLGEADIAAVVVARNERGLLPSFLRHYRRLGVTRFIFVDDQSDDQSQEFLCAQPDVDVWGSSIRFAEACGGMLWRERIFDQYGQNRWYLNIDADEYLIYDDCFNRPLPDLISHLVSQNCKRLSAPMIDMYPLGRLETTPLGNAGNMPWEVASWFDRAGYKLRMRRKNMKVLGGPRLRKFALDNQLMKYPVIFWDRKCSLRDGIHVPRPFQRNFSPISGVLLHFKFFADFENDLADAISDGQHYGNAREYKRMADAIKADGAPDFGSEVSTRYEGPEQMIKLGFMMPIWSGMARPQGFY